MRTSAPKSFSRQAGFTLTELSISIFISSILILSVLSAYSFLGRSLLRTGYAGQQESASRKTLYTFTKDVSGSSAVASPTASTVTLTTSAGTVVYTYTSSTGKLVRSLGGVNTTMLTGISALTFNFHDSNGDATTVPAAIKLIDVAFTTSAGSSIGGTLARLPVQSAMIMMRNKGYLQ